MDRCQNYRELRKYLDQRFVMAFPRSFHSTASTMLRISDELSVVTHDFLRDCLFLCDLECSSRNYNVTTSTNRKQATLEHVWMCNHVSCGSFAEVRCTLYESAASTKHLSFPARADGRRTCNCRNRQWKALIVAFVGDWTTGSEAAARRPSMCCKRSKNRGVPRGGWKDLW